MNKISEQEFKEICSEFESLIRKLFYWRQCNPGQPFSPIDKGMQHLEDAQAEFSRIGTL